MSYPKGKKERRLLSIANSSVLPSDEKCKAIKSLVQDGVDINAVGDYEYNALFMARDKDVMELLIENKININHTDQDGNSCLMDLVVSIGIYSDLIPTLIKAGANINIESNSGDTVLSKFIYSSARSMDAMGRAIEFDILDSILEKKPKKIQFDEGCKDPLVWAACYTDFKYVEKFLAMGCDINYNKFAYGTNVLMQTAITGIDEPSIYIKLIDLGADYKYKTPSGESIFDYLKSSGCIQTIDVLRSHIISKEALFEIDNDLFLNIKPSRVSKSL